MRRSTGAERTREPGENHRLLPAIVTEPIGTARGSAQFEVGSLVAWLAACEGSREPRIAGRPVMETTPRRRAPTRLPISSSCPASTQRKESGPL